MFLKTHAPITPSLRHSVSLTAWYLDFTKQRRLAVGFRRMTGRGVFGRKLTLSKGSVRSRQIFRNVNLSFDGLFTTSLVYEFQKDSSRSATLALIYNSLGC
jgi:ribosomal protein L2